MLIVDPPSGWMYGFPKPYNKPEGQSIEDWFLAHGYPQHLIDQGMLKYCRYWEDHIGGIVLNTLTVKDTV